LRAQGCIIGFTIGQVAKQRHVESPGPLPKRRIAELAKLVQAPAGSPGGGPQNRTLNKQARATDKKNPPRALAGKIDPAEIGGHQG